MRRPHGAIRLIAALIVTTTLLTACKGSNSPAVTRPKSPPSTRPTVAAAVDVYVHTRATDLLDVVKTDPPMVYVPNSESNTVDVIDPRTFAIVKHFAVGKLPQHVTPAWDMRTLYVDNDEGNSLTPIDPHTGAPGAPIPVDDPYNLYFTPDGTSAVVVAERLHRLDFRDPHTFAVTQSLTVACNGLDHADFSPDGLTMVISCEFSGDVVSVDVTKRTVAQILHVGGQPVDVKISPDGSVFYVANMERAGVSVIDASTFKERRFIPTGKGAHGLYPSRDGKWLYVTNRMTGTITVLDFATGAVHTTWKIGGSPDMGNVSADGTQLWVSGRYNGEIYVLDTTSGKVLHTIKVGKGPHGLCVWPQPGRYSIGHTGNTR